MFFFFNKNLKLPFFNFQNWKLRGSVGLLCFGYHRAAAKQEFMPLLLLWQLQSAAKLPDSSGGWSLNYDYFFLSYFHLYAKSNMACYCFVVLGRDANCFVVLGRDATILPRSIGHNTYVTNSLLATDIIVGEIRQRMLFAKIH